MHCGRRFFRFGLQFGEGLYSALSRKFGRYFGTRKGKDGKPQPVELKALSIQLRDLEMNWVALKQTVIKQGNISLTEINSMDVHDFFVTLTHIDDGLKKQTKRG